MKPLTPAQKQFFASWPGHAVVVRSVEDVAELVATWKENGPSGFAEPTRA